MPRYKKPIAAMLPVKKWLDLSEATAYTNTSIKTFNQDIAPLISVALLGKKKMFKVADIDALIEKNLITDHKY